MRYEQHRHRNRANLERRARLLVVVVMLGSAANAGAWGPGHVYITQGAAAALPRWEKDLLGAELDLLARQHCLIPDEVYTKKELRKYAMMDTKPEVFYLVELHLPQAAPENYALLRYFMKQAIEQFKAGKVDEGARFLGTISHVLEDWGCPAHSVPGDNMFTMMKQFAPPTDEYKHAPMHGPIENGKFTVELGDYKPRLLGTTLDEAAYNLLHRSQQSTIHARSLVIPIMQALYAKDEEAANAAQQKAGQYDAAVVADMIHTVLCLAKGKVDDESTASLTQVDLSARIPLEAVHLFLPQTSFHGKPYWSHPLRGVTMAQGKQAVAIKLKIVEKERAIEKTMEEAMAAGTKSVLTYLLPPAVYDRLEVWAGLHAELGVAGDVVFEIKGSDGKTLAKAQVRGDEPARRLVAPLAGQTSVQLITTSGGKDATSNYAVWGEPRLIKSAGR